MTVRIQRQAQNVKVAPLKVGEAGTVPIQQVMENPCNPRTWFDPLETEEMATSIQKGGQREIATVRHSTDEERKEFPGVYYVVTSGGRRFRGSKKAGATTYDVRVKEYASLGQEKLDMLLLNENRKTVSDLELAWYYGALMEDNGWNQRELAEEISRSEVWVSDRVMILKCTPKVQDRMHPRHRSKMMNLQVGVLYSALQAELQDELIDKMPSDLETAVAQKAWVTKQLHLRGKSLARRERKPTTYRRILKLFTTVVRDKADMALAPEFKRIFENTSDGDAKQLAADLRTALLEFQKLVVAVETYAAQEKAQTMLVPREKMPQAKKAEMSAQVTPASDGRVRVTDSPHIRSLRSRAPGHSVSASQIAERHNAHAQVRSKPVFHVGVPVQRILAAAVPAVIPTTQVIDSQKPSNSTMVTVEFLHENGRLTMDKIDLRQYAKLYDENRLRFQVEKTKKPDHYPNRNDICG